MANQLMPDFRPKANASQPTGGGQKAATSLMPNFRPAAFEDKIKGLSHEQIVEMYRSLPQGDPMLPFLTKKISEPLPGETPEQAAERAGGKSKTDNTINPLASYVLSSGDFPTMGYVDEAAAGIKSLVTGRPFEAVHNEMQQVQQMSQEQNPIASAAGTLTGVIAAAPLTLEAMGGNLLSRAAIAGGEQAAQMGLYATGSGDGSIGERLSGAVDDAALGAGVGFGTPLVLKGLGLASRPLVNAYNTIKGGADKGGVAQRLVGDALKKDIDGAATSGAPILTEAEAAAARLRGQNSMVADFGNQEVGSLARRAANTSSEARDILSTATGARYADQGNRVTSFIDRMYGGLNSENTINTLRRAYETSAAPLYQRAMNDPTGRTLFTSKLQNLMQAPAVQRAISEAERRSANNAVATGGKAVRNPFVRDANGNLVLNNAATGATPSLAFWDTVKRGLDDQISTLYRAGKKDTARDIKKIRDDLRDHLDTMVPTYKQARGAAAAFFGAEDAFEAGQKFAKQTSDADVTKAERYINDLRNAASDPMRSDRTAKAAELALFERGFMSEYAAKLGSKNDSTDISRILMGSPLDRKKFEAAVQGNRRDMIEAMSKVEDIYQRLHRRVGGNSTTAQQLAEMGLFGAGGGLGGYLFGGGDPTSMGLGAALAGAGRFGMNKANEKIMRDVAEILTRGGPDQTQKLIEKAAKDRRVMNAISEFSNNLARVGVDLGASAMIEETPEQGFRKGGAVRALVGAAKKAKAAPKPKLEGEALIEDWKWRPEQEVADELGLSGQYMPDEVQNFGYFMKEMSDKAASQGLSKRDLIKAFAITRSSIQRRAQKADKLRANGFDIPNAGETVRPEGAMAEWFFTPMGQRYLDNAEKGVIDEDAIVDFQKKFKPFGKAAKDVPDFMRGAVTTFDEDYVKQLSDLVARGGRGENVRNEWRAATSRLRGIGPAKKGFIGSMVGYGDMPTADARQLVLQTGRPSKEASKFMSRRKGKGGEAAVDRLAERQRNIGMKLPAELDPYYQHLAHHTIWDKTAGERTTHDDLMRAMRFAAMAGVIPAGVASQYISALEDEKNGVQTFSKGGLAQFAHAVGGIPFSGGSKGGVARAAMDFVTRALGTNDISETTLADIARMHNITPEQLATGYSALEHGAKSKKTGKTRDVIRNWKFKTSQGQQPLLKREAFNPNEMRVGDVWIPMHGDRTSLDVDIHEVEDVPLVSPTRTSGGIDFMLSDHQQQEGAMWRSDPNVITSLNNKADNAANVSRRIYGRDPNVYAAFINMGKRSGDYSGQPLDVAANMIPNMNISRDAIGAYNKKMEEFIGEKNASRAEDYDKSMSSYEKKREKLQSRLEKEMSALEKEKKPERRAKREERVAAVAEKLDSLVLPTRDDLPQWPGIENRLDLLHMIQQPTQGIGEVRKYATQLMDMPDFFDAGFPNMGAVRLATTKPELAAMDDYAHTGWLIGKREGFGDNAVERNPLLYHPSYAHNWKGRPAGGLAAALTDREFFERWAKLFKRRLGDKNDSPQAFYKSLANRRAYQLADQEFIDKLAALEEAARSRR